MLALTSLLSSCSHDNPILETIPSDVNTVAKINGTKFFEALEIKLENGKITLPDYLTKDLKEDNSDKAAKILSVIDTDNIFFVIDSKMAVVLTAGVKDSEAFAKAVTEISESEAVTEEGYKVWKNNNIVLGDNQMWVALDYTGKSGAVSIVKNLLKKAGEKSIAELSGVAAALNANDLFNAAQPNPAVTADNKTAWSISTGNINGNKLTLKSGLIWDNGDKASIDWLTDINPKSLDYTPANAFCTAACGLSNKIPWGDILNKIASNAGMTVQQAGFINILVPYLQGINGTMLLSVGSADGMTPAQAITECANGNVKAISLVIMTAYDSAKAHEIINMIKGQGAAALGIPVIEDADGIHINIPEAGCAVSLNYADGNLIFRLPDNAKAGNGTGIKLDIAGKTSAMNLEIPSLSEFAPSFNYGIKLTCESKGADATGVFELTGTDAPLLPTIIKSCQAL